MQCNLKRTHDVYRPRKRHFQKKKNMECPFRYTASARDKSLIADLRFEPLIDLKYIGHGRSATEIWARDNTVNIDLGDETKDLLAQGA